MKMTDNLLASSKQQAASSKQQAASSKQQAASSKQQAASSKQQAASSKQQASNIFWISSAIAIYMVICAHCTYDNYYLQRITSIFGSIGVPIFLIRSGFYLNIEEPAKRYWLKKIRSIIVPWLIISPCLYLFSIFRNIASFSLVDCFLYCIGYRTWLYYIFILIVYYAVFRLLKEDWFLYVSIALFIISNILDVYGINWISNYSTPYLNFFNRIGYFAIGILLNKNNLFDRLVNNRILSVICTAIVYTKTRFWTVS